MEKEGGGLGLGKILTPKLMATLGGAASLEGEAWHKAWMGKHGGRGN